MNTNKITETGNNNIGMDMRKVFLRKVKAMLEKEKNEIITRVENNAKNGEIDAAGDELDRIQANIIALAASQLASRDKDKIAKINGALKRISDQTFGVCGECSEDIDEKRLLINPSFVLCTGCAEIRELKAKKGI